MKKGILMLMVCLLLTGCGPYVSVTPHREQRQSGQSDVAAASNYLELLTALKATIASGTEVATITVADYPPETLERGIWQAALYARSNDPIGSYAVESIEYELGTRNGIPAVSVRIDYLHNRSEQHLRTHSGNGYHQQHLHTVLYAFNGSRFVAVAGNTLQACTQSKEACAQGHPQLHDDYNAEDVVGVGKPLLCAVDNAQLDEISVCNTVGVAREDELPCGIDVACKRRSVENKRENGFQYARHFVNKPCKQEAHYVGKRARYDSEHKGVLYRGKENLVLQEQCVKVVEAYPLRELNHVEVGEADRQRDNNRYQRKYSKQREEGSNKHIHTLVALHQRPCVTNLAILQMHNGVARSS